MLTFARRPWMHRATFLLRLVSLRRCALQRQKTVIAEWKTRKLQLSALADYIPENTRRLPNVGLMLAHRLQRWPNIRPTPRVCWDNLYLILILER